MPSGYSPISTLARFGSIEGEYAGYKGSAMKLRHFRADMSEWTAALLLALVLLMPAAASAQNPPAPATSDQQVLKPEQLDALVAPIALYPDTLLAQVLMASTYPLEVVQADRWMTERKSLDGDRLKKEVEKQAWDDSVKSLVATPSVLTMMSKKLDWTQQLGDAVLAQQPDVMDAIQRLRSKAYANEKLKSTNEQKVTVRQEGNRQLVAIEPTDPNTLYVPYYDPAVVYGAWPYPAYPPYYYYPDENYLPGIIGTGIAFGAGYALWRWVSGGRFWGGGINWGGGNININRGAHVEHWRHNPQHRRGVAYNNANVRQQFAGANRPGNKGKPDFRGSKGQQVLKPGGDRAKVAKQQPGNRAKAGDRGRGKQAVRRMPPDGRLSGRPAAPPPARRLTGSRTAHRASLVVAGAVMATGRRAGVVSAAGALAAAGASEAGAADAGRISPSSTTSSFSVVSTAVSGSTGLPTMAPTRPMSV
jgi:hypothetical protein